MKTENAPYMKTLEVAFMCKPMLQSEVQAKLGPTAKLVAPRGEDFVWALQVTNDKPTVTEVCRLLGIPFGTVLAWDYIE